jgi:hypothetical protein
VPFFPFEVFTILPEEVDGIFGRMLCRLPNFLAFDVLKSYRDVDAMDQNNFEAVSSFGEFCQFKFLARSAIKSFRLQIPITRTPSPVFKLSPFFSHQQHRLSLILNGHSTMTSKM